MRGARCWFPQRCDSYRTWYNSFWNSSQAQSKIHRVYKLGNEMCQFIKLGWACVQRYKGHTSLSSGVKCQCLSSKTNKVIDHTLHKAVAIKTRARKMNGNCRNTRLSAAVSSTCWLPLTLKSSYKCSDSCRYCHILVSFNKAAIAAQVLRHIGKVYNSRTMCAQAT